MNRVNTMIVDDVEDPAAKITSWLPEPGTGEIKTLPPDGNDLLQPELAPLGKGQAELEAALKRLKKQREDFARLCAEPASGALMRSLEPEAIRYDRYRLIGARVLQGLFARLIDEQAQKQLQQPDAPYTPPNQPLAWSRLGFAVSALLRIFGTVVDPMAHARLQYLHTAPPWERSTMFHTIGAR